MNEKLFIEYIEYLHLVDSLKKCNTENWRNITEKLLEYFDWNVDEFTKEQWIKLSIPISFNFS
jgi:hypothetical protein